MNNLYKAAQQALEYMKSVGKMDMYPEEWAIVGRLEAALAGPPKPASLKRGTTGRCTRKVCECEKEGLGLECIHLEPVVDGYPLWSGIPKAEPVEEPVAWMRVIDEAMVVHHCGVADPADDYQTAKRKMNTLMCTAQDIGKYFAKQAESEPCQYPDCVDNGPDVECTRWLLDECSMGEDYKRRRPAEPQEPVAWMFVDDTGMKFVSVDQPHKHCQPLYTAPPQMKPLTKESLLYIYNQLPNWGMDMDRLPQGLEKFARAVEEWHGIK